MSSHTTKRNVVGAEVHRNILGINVHVVDCNEAIDHIVKTVENGEHKKFAFLNAHGANISYHDDEYRGVLSQFSVLADGIGVDIGSRILYGATFPENLNGTDFVPRMLSQLPADSVIGLFGATPAVAQNALERFSETYPQHSFRLLGDGYFETADEEAVLENLKSLRPDVLLVALGNPYQEKWISKNCNESNAKVAIGVGALFDFTTGHVRRAPNWMISMRIEWLFRLGLEPARLWRRYIIGNPLFLFRILKQKTFGLGKRGKECE